MYIYHGHKNAHILKSFEFILIYFSVYKINEDIYNSLAF